MQLDRAQLLFRKRRCSPKCSGDWPKMRSKMPRSLWKPRSNTCDCSVWTRTIPSGVVDVRCADLRHRSPTSKLPMRRACKACPAPIHSPSLTCLMCGLFVTCTRTLSPQVHIGDYADIHLNAYPDKVLKGRVNNIGAILDPNIRTAKVRLEVENPGLMRLGMFVTATFHGRADRKRAPRFPRPQFCTCTIATGSLRLWVMDISGGWKSSPAACFRKHAGDRLGNQTRSTGGSECAGIAEHGGAIDDSPNC